MSNGHTGTVQASHKHAYCTQCATHVIPNRGRCGWCDARLSLTMATRRERLSMQRAYEVTLVRHGGRIV